MEFDVNLDYGYGSGGPHITPDKSMQQLVWSETEVSGGRRIRTKLKRPSFNYEKQVKAARLKRRRPLNPKVLEMLKEVDSYRYVAVIAIPLPFFSFHCSSLPHISSLCSTENFLSRNF